MLSVPACCRANDLIANLQACIQEEESTRSCFQLQGCWQRQCSLESLFFERAFGSMKALRHSCCGSLVRVGEGDHVPARKSRPRLPKGQEAPIGEGALPDTTFQKPASRVRRGNIYPPDCA